MLREDIMENKSNELIDPLLKKGNLYKLQCEQCNSISVQITQNNQPDLHCLDCGGNCKVVK